VIERASIPRVERILAGENRMNGFHNLINDFGNLNDASARINILLNFAAG
jgi:hypothetical protein